jgi:hypothetical protein
LPSLWFLSYSHAMMLGEVMKEAENNKTRREHVWDWLLEGASKAFAHLIMHGRVSRCRGTVIVFVIIVFCYYFVLLLW